jgi:hypothetical protein
MDAIPAGRYLVLAGQNGAANPLARLDLDVLNQTSMNAVSESLVKDVLGALTVVTIDAGKTADVTVSLNHGGLISGQLTFDDGSPAVGAKVHLLSKGKSGQFVEPNMMSLGGVTSNATLLGYMTDDSGRFRIAGLVPGSYALRAELPINALKNLTKNLAGMMTMSMVAPGATQQASPLGEGLSVYSGNVLFKKDLKAIELGADEQMTSADITIPLDGMHSVTARVVDSAAGKGMAVAQLLLLDADGKETLRSGFVDENGECTFDYVPEGLYTLRVANAMDTSKVGKMRDEDYDPKKAVRYGSAETKVQVNNDVSGVQLTVSRIAAEEKSAH